MGSVAGILGDRVSANAFSRYQGNCTTREAESSAIFGLQAPSNL
jgi:hypothetical protein